MIIEAADINFLAGEIAGYLDKPYEIQAIADMIRRHLTEAVVADGWPSAPMFDGRAVRTRDGCKAVYRRYQDSSGTEWVEYLTEETPWILSDLWKQFAEKWQPLPAPPTASRDEGGRS